MKEFRDNRKMTAKRLLSGVERRQARLATRCLNDDTPVAARRSLSAGYESGNNSDGFSSAAVPA